MRRLVIALTIAALAAGLLTGPADAGKKKKPKPRTAEAAYDGPAIGVGGVGGVCSGSQGCVQFPLGPTEGFISLESDDSSGQPVFLRVVQDTNGDGTNEGVGSWCGTTGEPIAVTPGVPATVFIYAVGANPPCPGPATGGTVKAVISSTP